MRQYSTEYTAVLMLDIITHTFSFGIYMLWKAHKHSAVSQTFSPCCLSKQAHSNHKRPYNTQLFFLFFYTDLLNYFINPLWKIQAGVPGQFNSSYKSGANCSYQCMQ